MGLLSRRDHSELELRQKLAQRQCPPEDIETAIHYCTEHNWLNDQRFAEALLRQGIAKGHGWQRICLDARKKGVDMSFLDLAQENAQYDWYEIARETALRKYGDLDGQIPAVEFKEQARRIRYLQYRGFNYDQINYALSSECFDD
ncbi:RecX family transcriptional regulator [Veronia pacifica]|uniref:Regulatory protein RecX n=1 Tax=Veronia pacifica TaxID=1080227 RepID=A0A1C3EDN1_9GAMM|nr:regulatory protein RecX [Veronia pacifica]ODA31356.1 RecX family transcriptional regulator [Veronia pacifica]